MKAAEYNNVMQGLELPVRFKKKGRLAYYHLEHESSAKILVAIFLDSSIDPHCFYIQQFVQCLYVPFPTYIFSLGDRIGGLWQTTDITAINHNLKNFKQFDTLNSFEAFVPYLEQNKYYGDVIGRNLYFALTHFILKNYKKALPYLNEIIDMENPPNLDWQQQNTTNAAQIKNIILEENYQAGLSQILSWQEETISSLKLTFNKF
jgi:hypothetical protein